MSFGKPKLSRARFFQIEGETQLYPSSSLTISASNSTFSTWFTQSDTAHSLRCVLLPVPDLGFLMYWSTVQSLH